MITVYSTGLCHCSVCAPANMDPPAVAAEVNLVHPTGIDSKWKPSEDKEFVTGEPNPCVCNDDPDRRHHLLVC